MEHRTASAPRAEDLGIVRTWKFERPGHGAWLALLAAWPAHVQAAPVLAEAAAESTPATVSELVITADRPTPPGAVIGDVPPELTLAPADIQAYGVSSIADLLGALAPEVRSDRGRGGGGGPVVLINGRRISGFAEIRDLPTEAILRVDILPEEAALKYGYAANQRVVNFVLRPRFKAITAEVSGSAPTAGGREGGQAELGIFRIVDDNRANLDLKYQASSALTEAERDLTSLSSGQAFDLAGNLRSPTPGAQIDPALSALAGQPVIIAGVPAGADGRVLPLADFLPTAGIANASDVRRYRTLLPKTRLASANAVYSHPLFAGINASFNATLEATSSDARLGLPGVALQVPAGGPFSPFSQPVEVDRYVAGLGALGQSNDGWTGHLGTTFNKDVAKWRLSLTAAYDHADTRTESDTGIDTTALQALLTSRSASANPFGTLPAALLTMRAPNTAHSTSDGGNAQLVASGPLFNLPAGAVRASLRVGDAYAKFSSDSERLGVERSANFSRNTLNAQANFDLPLTSKRQGFLPRFGELSANFNVAADQLSDFGTLTTLGYGLNWRPTNQLSFLVTNSHDQDAPTQQQLGNPLVLTAGTRLFDYATGQTVDVNSISGGNPALLANTRDVLKLGATWKPFTAHDLTLTANYVDSHERNPILTFPAATAAIEAAFPDRFVRGANGQLTQVDYRPVNFASLDRSELRWGLNYSKPIGPKTAPQPGRFPGGPGGRGPGTSLASGPFADGGGTGPPAGGGFVGGGPPGGFGGPGGGGGGRGGGGRGGGQEGRLQISLYHTVIFRDEYLVRRGGPVLDLLNGAAAGNGGGQPQHEVEAQFGVSERGMGARLSADWKSGSTVDGAPGSPTGDLRFSDISTINLRLFADLSQQKTLIAKAPFLKGSRITLGVTNIFDAKVKVRDASGATPLSYQPDYIDPLGRVIRISFRKLFL